MKTTTALAAEANSTNALEMPGIALISGENRIIQPDTIIAFAGTL